MRLRPAQESDLDQLAVWNKQLIEDEGHINPMTVPQLRDRMRGWLLDRATHLILFHRENLPVTGPQVVGYLLYTQDEKEVYLRHFFVSREHRRQGLGRLAIDLARTRLWPKDRRLRVDVLVHNEAGLAFWRAAGFADYCLTLQIPAN